METQSRGDLFRIAADKGGVESLHIYMYIAQRKGQNRDLQNQSRDLRMTDVITTAVSCITYGNSYRVIRRWERFIAKENIRRGLIASRRSS